MTWSKLHTLSESVLSSIKEEHCSLFCRLKSAYRALYELYRYCFPEKLYLFSSVFRWCKHLQGIFPTQESNLGLPHCRQTLYSLSHHGKKSLIVTNILLFQIMTVRVTLASASPIKTMDLLKNKPGDFLKINNYSLINFEARALVTYPKSSLGSEFIMYSSLVVPKTVWS